MTEYPTIVFIHAHLHGVKTIFLKETIMASWDINKLVERKLEYNDRQEAYIQKLLECR